MKLTRAHILTVGLFGFLLGVTTAAAADIQVIDGGKLALNGRTVRLWGIDVPSAAEVCVTTNGRSWPCGQRAQAELRSAVRDGPVVCQPKARGFDVCRIAGLDVAALLVKEGLVKARDDYQELEARARQARVGLWE